MYEDFYHRARTFVNKDDIQLRVAFDQVDTDSSGSIDLDELYNAMRALGREMPMKQVQGIMDEYDTDKSGEIDFDEFKDMMDGLKNKNKLNDDRFLVCNFDLLALKYLTFYVIYNIPRVPAVVQTDFDQTFFFGVKYQN